MERVKMKCLKKIGRGRERERGRLLEVSVEDMNQENYKQISCDINNKQTIR